MQRRRPLRDRRCELSKRGPRTRRLLTPLRGLSVEHFCRLPDLRRQLGDHLRGANRLSIHFRVLLLFDGLSNGRHRLDVVSGIEPRRVEVVHEPGAPGQPLGACARSLVLSKRLISTTRAGFSDAVPFSRNFARESSYSLAAAVMAAEAFSSDEKSKYGTAGSG